MKHSDTMDNNIGDYISKYPCKIKTSNADIKNSNSTNITINNNVNKDSL